jgi:hypothetical protein
MLIGYRRDRRREEILLIEQRCRKNENVGVGVQLAQKMRMLENWIVAFESE